MDNGLTIQKCRTCLKNSTKWFPLINAVRGCTPKRTYRDLLKEYAHFEYNADYEQHMPQYLCLLCCRQLRSTYVFIQQAQQCNLKLINAISKQLDCLKEQTIDLPDIQDSISISIKEESVHLDDPDIQNSFGNENFRTQESSLNANESFKAENIFLNKQKPRLDFKNILETGDNFNSEINQDVNVLDNKQENSLSLKTEKSDDIQCPVCNKLTAKHDLVNHMRFQHDITEAEYFTLLAKEQSINKYQDMKYTKEKHQSGEATNLEKSSIQKPRPIKKIIKCQSCEYTANSYAALNYHNRSKHGTEDDKLKCKFCSYATFKKCNLLVHVKKIHKEVIKSLMVNAADNTYESVNSNSYNNECKRSDRPETVLDEENSSNSDISSSDDDLPLARTITKTKGEQDKEEFIDEDFIRRILNIRKRQSKMLPTKALARRCEQCGNIYKNYQSLLTHQRTVHISEDKFSLCPHCGKKYKRKIDLRIHIEKAHVPKKDTKTSNQQTEPKAREKRFMCTQCSYTCATITILNIHINRHHTGERPYKCDICSKSFVVPYDLRIHRYLHTGEKPYKCPICSKGFRDNSHMIKHKRIHSNERPYKCNECGKSFTQSYNLSVHKRTHLKEKKLNCSICGKLFENKSMLNIHRINENHHDEVA